ncbi:MAG TPA: ABC transporter ATP-binding protein [Deltaproteobacteria bacterium]|nr:ABC transporter ATP-binding protein [Deltaproteobacteria bacterium]
MKGQGSDVLLEAKNLRVVRGGSVLVDVPSFVVRKGDVLAVIGPNGAGKTTLLQALAYLLKPFEGTVFFEGLEVAKGISVLDYRRRLAMAFQEPLLFDTTVYQNVASGLKIRGMTKRLMRERVDEALGLFGISHLADRSARTLSGGEAQRTNIARAFATNPALLFLDEPFNALDQPSHEALVKDLRDIVKKTDITVAFVTHNRLEALQLATAVAAIQKGRITQFGSVEDVMNDPKNSFIASFVGMDCMLPARILSCDGNCFVADVKRGTIEGVGDFQIGDRVTLCIRPENVALSIRTTRNETSVRNLFPARITSVVPSGPFYKVELDCGFPLASFVTAASVKQLSLREGGEIFASFKATSVHAVRRGDTEQPTLAGGTDVTSA